MRIGIRLAISGLVLASIMVSAIGVHILWWRTAEANSHALADTINGQIVSAVEKELATITTEARAAHTAIRTLFVQHVLETREADKREFVFLSQLQSQPNISWVAFGWPDGAFFAAHKLGDLGLEMMEIAPVEDPIQRPIDVYQKRQGVLAIIIEYTRFAQFLSHLSVGKSGAAFILGHDGTTIAAPDQDADEVNMLRAESPLL